MRRLTLVAAWTAVAIAAACGGGESGSGADTAAGLSGADSIAAVKSYRAGDLVVENVVAPAPVPTSGGPSPIAVYFVVRNTGATADTLDAIEITGGTATLHQQTGTGGAMETMVPLAFAAIPAGESLRFAPGGRHVMIEGLARPVTAGDVLPMTMLFRRSGRAPVSARVVRYGELEGVLSSGAGEHTGH
jgi:copper(I)-binding protein